MNGRTKSRGNLNDPQVLSKLDVLTRQGRRHHVLKELLVILKEKPDQAFLPKLARIANRNQAPILALRILHSIIRDNREGIRPASSEALNVYASALMSIGALEESQEILQRIKDSTDALLTEAFVYFAQWNYQKSIPVLAKYVNSPQLSPYQRHVGQINRLAALIVLGRVSEALELSSSLHLSLRGNAEYKLLFGNCCELQAQIELLRKSHKKALEFLEVAHSCLAEQRHYLLYVNKWKAVANLGISPTDEKAMASLLSIRNEALKLKSWETVRDCDFHWARVSQNHESMQRILLGTPYSSFHLRAQNLYGVRLENNRTLNYCPHKPFNKPTAIDWDLDRISDVSFMNSTSWPLIQLLTKDIYRPPRIGVVFAKLYPNEHFNPFTSPQRVRNSVFRFNSWTQNNSVSFKIKASEGEFMLVGSHGSGISCTQTLRPLGSWQAALKLFKSQNNTKSFKAETLAYALNISHSSALGILKKALEANKVKKIGNGRNSRYIFFSGRRGAIRPAAS